MKQILIVEDDPQFLEIYRLKLLKLGYQIATASNISEAHKALRERVPSVVLLDIMLNDHENGFDLLRQMKETFSQAKTQVIVLTNLPADHEKTARALGASRFFVKAQTGIDTVIQTICGLLAKKHAAGT